MEDALDTRPLGGNEGGKRARDSVKLIDGSSGEGGGQVLRTSLALSMVTGQPFRIVKIRHHRAKPGLRRQHLTAVLAAREICGAEVSGAELGSVELSFVPGAVRPGDYAFAVGTAGSTTLILQTLLPALVLAAGPSRVRLEGGTHNPMAPPFDFLVHAFLPLLERMGPRVRATLERPGFYPAGGGSLAVEIEPCESLRGFDLLAAGKLRQRTARVLIARLPRHIAERELKWIASRTNWPDECYVLEELTASQGPGNVVLIEVASEHVTEVFTAFGEIGVRAEAVAGRAVRALRRYQKAGVPVGEYLADQFLLPLALAGSGSFKTLPLSPHATTQIELIGRFLDVGVEVEQTASESCVVRIGT